MFKAWHIEARIADTKYRDYPTLAESISFCISLPLYTANPEINEPSRAFGKNKPMPNHIVSNISNITAYSLICSAP